MKKLARIAPPAAPPLLVLLVLLAVTACGGATEADDSTTSTAQGPAASAPEGAGQGGPGGGAPGASGLVAALNGRTMQVQSEASGQVAVTWTGSTTFTEQVEGSLADVTVGSCVMVTSNSESGAEEPVHADNVRVVPATDGDCAAGFDGPRDGDLPEGMPTDLPTDRPEGMAGAGGAFGIVTAISANGFTVESSVSGAGESDGDEATTAVTVVVGQATTYTTTVEAAADAVEVGRCVTASGEADDTGAVTAATVAVSDSTDGTCTTGLRPMGAPPVEGDPS